MHIFNPIQDLDLSDTYTEKNEIQWKRFKLSSGHRAPRFIKKSVKKFGKNTNIEIQQNPGVYI